MVMACDVFIDVISVVVHLLSGKDGEEIKVMDCVLLVTHLTWCVVNLTTQML